MLQFYFIFQKFNISETKILLYHQKTSVDIPISITITDYFFEKMIPLFHLENVTKFAYPLIYLQLIEVLHRNLKWLYNTISQIHIKLSITLATILTKL